jgi:hypothetical protein
MLDMEIAAFLNGTIRRRNKIENGPGLQVIRVVGSVVIFALLTQDQCPAAQLPEASLTNASDILSLSTEQASLGISVCVNGVVTAAQPEWNGQFYVQDGTGGIFVNNLRRNHPEPGDKDWNCAVARAQAGFRRAINGRG